MFGAALADVWDAMYEGGRGKSYLGEAALLSDLVKRSCPEADSLLDAGCGTGRHLAGFERYFSTVHGFDVAPAMVDHARTSAERATIWVDDLRTFSAPRTYDAVVSLYTVIGYLDSLAEVTAAVRRMWEHVRPGGVLVVEPWWFAERYLDGHRAYDRVHSDRGLIVRTSSTSRSEDGGHAEMDIHYLVGHGASVRHFSEVHRFGLWRQAEYEAAFAAAGVDADYRPDLLECGCFVAVKPC